MNVRDVMSEPITIAAEAPVEDVARRILDSGAAGLAVVDAEGAILGVVTRADLVTKHARPHFPTYLGILGGIVRFNSHRNNEEMRRILSVTARDLMTEDVETVDADLSVDDAASIMVERDADPLLVMEDERLVGVLTDTDIIRLLLREESDEGSGAED
ncbi:MAG: CBS domain-containing protein [Chloroflexota bacterium]